MSLPLSVPLIRIYIFLRERRKGMRIHYAGSWLRNAKPFGFQMRNSILFSLWREGNWKLTASISEKKLANFLSFRCFRLSLTNKNFHGVSCKFPNFSFHNWIAVQRQSKTNLQLSMPAHSYLPKTKQTHRIEELYLKLNFRIRSHPHLPKIIRYTQRAKGSICRQNEWIICIRALATVEVSGKNNVCAKRLPSANIALLV